MADAADRTGNVTERTWEREVMLESLESYRRGLFYAPIIHKWSFLDGKHSAGEGMSGPVSGAEAHCGGVKDPGVQEGQDSMTFVLSTDEVDRHGDVIAASGWKLEYYSRNPVFLWAHDYARPVIGRAAEVWKEPHSLLARIEFAPTAFAREVASLYRGGFQRGVSVGFKPLRYEERRHEKTGALLGLRFLEQELLETSAVPVPSNRSALRRTLDEADLNKRFALTKGFLWQAAQTIGGGQGPDCEACASVLHWLSPELSACLDDLERLTGELLRRGGQAGEAAGREVAGREGPSEEVERVLRALRGEVH